MTKQLPLVVILGATACGKSKLAIDIARKFGGEIISADSMQVYKGLDIVTNKVSPEEQKLAKHHMIDFLNPMKRYSVVDFKRQSLKVIDELFSKDILPIVVGGTHYYIESLLWKEFILDSDKKHQNVDQNSSSEKDNFDVPDTTIIDNELKLMEQTPKGSHHNEDDLSSIEKFFKKPIYIQSLDSIKSEKLWNILKQVDPEASNLFHPNNKRRIVRVLQIYQETGKRYTEMLDEVNKSAKDQNSTSLGGPLRYQPTCIFWLDYEIERLDKVCDERVDKMIERGLLSELEDFHEKFNRDRIEQGDTEKPDYYKGIFQTIGFKEFHEYLMLDHDEKKSTKGQKVLADSIETMKLFTRKYARYQLKWIKKRFLTHDLRDLPPVFKLTTCYEEELWDDCVRQPAFKILDHLIKGEQLGPELLTYKQETNEKTLVNNPAKHYCEVCERTFIGTFQIGEHMRSKTHWRQVERLNFKKAKLEVG